MPATRLLFSIVIVSALMLGSAFAADESEDAATSPELIAVTFHADWCGSCKKLEPVVKEVAGQLADQPILFVTLDLTTPEGRDQAAYLMDAIGAGEAWAEHGKKTGFVLLLDGSDLGIKDKLTANLSTNDMLARIQSARS